MLLVLPTRAQPRSFHVDVQASVVEYTGSAPLHDWTGTSREASGRLDLDLDAPSQSRVEVRVPVASFDSGNGRRDRKMRDITDSDAHPDVTFASTAIEPALWGQTGSGQGGRWRVRGDLTFHGVTRAVEVPVRVSAEGGAFRAEGDFEISLEAYDVPRPKLAFVPIADTIRIRFELVAAP